MPIFDSVLSFGRKSSDLLNLATQCLSTSVDPGTQGAYHKTFIIILDILSVFGSDGFFYILPVWSFSLALGPFSQPLEMVSMSCRCCRRFCCWCSWVHLTWYLLPFSYPWCRPDCTYTSAQLLPLFLSACDRAELWLCSRLVVTSCVIIPLKHLLRWLSMDINEQVMLLKIDL